MTRRWPIDLPTRIHLWSAEFQIRHRSSADPERLRNLDVLRDYRKSRAFPRNDTGLPSTPYFVDRDGRHCAVGHLMRESGEHNAVRRIAAEANLARIDDMDPAVLADWTERSGLTKRELARIQPGYPNESQAMVDLFLYTVQLLIPFALLSFVLERIKSHRTVLRRSLVLATLAVCTAWTLLSMIARGSDLGGEPTTIEMTIWYVVLLGPVLLAVALAILARRGQVRDGAVAPIAGVTTGALMTVLAVGYIVLDFTVPDETDTSVRGGAMSPAYPGFASLPAVVALVLGLLTLVWAVRALRWRVRV
jgi:hypothetical protein